MLPARIVSVLADGSFESSTSSSASFPVLVTMSPRAPKSSAPRLTTRTTLMLHGFWFGGQSSSGVVAEAAVARRQTASGVRRMNVRRIGEDLLPTALA